LFVTPETALSKMYGMCMDKAIRSSETPFFTGFLNNRFRSNPVTPTFARKIKGCRENAQENI
jgi:hypothetical protein